MTPSIACTRHPAWGLPCIGLFTPRPGEAGTKSTPILQKQNLGLTPSPPGLLHLFEGKKRKPFTEAERLRASAQAVPRRQCFSCLPAVGNPSSPSGLGSHVNLLLEASPDPHPGQGPLTLARSILSASYHPHCGCRRITVSAALGSVSVFPGRAAPVLLFVPSAPGTVVRTQ